METCKGNADLEVQLLARVHRPGFVLVRLNQGGLHMRGVSRGETQRGGQGSGFRVQAIGFTVTALQEPTNAWGWGGGGENERVWAGVWARVQVHQCAWRGREREGSVGLGAVEHHPSTR